MATNPDQYDNEKVKEKYRTDNRAYRGGRGGLGCGDAGSETKTRRPSRKPANTN